MNQTSLEDIKTKMDQASAFIEQAMDLSVPLLKTNQKNNVTALWEAFIKRTIAYDRQKAKLVGTNLIKNISLSRIMFR
ncbi:MAG: hypothetical protein GX952_00745 [Firmicutes bacterium]|nr:hypothetical protein [Bacillota bacterium]